MNFVSPILHAPEELIGTYQYDPDFFGPVEDIIKQDILAYDPAYGPYLWNHLLRTSSDLELFMIQEGYNLEDAQATGHAFLLHDADKILQDIEVWRLEKEKRRLTEEQKQERPNHTRMNSRVVSYTIGRLGLSPDLNHEKHLMLIRYLTQYHHERLDGSGPHGLMAQDIGPILRMAAIVDTVDGKLKAKDLSMIFSEMGGAKHEGEFDPELVVKYRTLFGNRNYADRVLTLELANP